ncbi:hypothetical protein B0H16DRAFT_1460185 [Mycena metata]|uniref:Uncharacterized protein n=1 Tax=Mycena metata TaxID=1033252 RepID=A0AAD7IZD7_9AGAR|nr:hypothetical protein B0H16DRAFT_1460185 [Mycena metata]
MTKVLVLVTDHTVRPIEAKASISGNDREQAHQAVNLRRRHRAVQRAELSAFGQQRSNCFDDVGDDDNKKYAKIPGKFTRAKHILIEKTVLARFRLRPWARNAAADEGMVRKEVGPTLRGTLGATARATSNCALMELQVLSAVAGRRLAGLEPRRDSSGSHPTPRIYYWRETAALRRFTGHAVRCSQPTYGGAADEPVHNAREPTRRLYGGPSAEEAANVFTGRAAGCTTAPIDEQALYPAEVL